MGDVHLIRKLEAFAPLPSKDVAALTALAAKRVCTCAGGEDLISEGDEPKTIFLVLEGWACRYKTLEDGRRQILALFVPGDLCDLHVYILSKMDHSIAALTPLRFAKIAPSDLEELADAHPRVMRALWWESLVTAAIQREWLVSAGQRSAIESLAHLACETYLRLRLVGLAERDSCAFPLTQANIADALGLTQPHVSRVVRELNATGLATLQRRRLTVHDPAGLQALAGFNPNYLHFR
jgi:CRP-like cAMP-binding protein